MKCIHGIAGLAYCSNRKMEDQIYIINDIDTMSGLIGGGRTAVHEDHRMNVKNEFFGEETKEYAEKNLKKKLINPDSREIEYEDKKSGNV